MDEGGVYTVRLFSEGILTANRNSTGEETSRIPIGTPMHMSVIAPTHMSIGRPTSMPVSTSTYSLGGTLTPDFSAPQVVPGQFSRPMSYASLRGARPYGFKEHVDSYDGPEAAPPPTIPTAPKEKRTCGMKRRHVFIFFACIVIAILVLALGLGLGLGLRKNGSSVHPFVIYCERH